MKKFVFFVLLILSFSQKIKGDVGDYCYLKDGSNGICRKSGDCQWAIKELADKTITHKDLVSCGFEGVTIIICCKEKVIEKVEVAEEKEPMKSDVACSIIDQRPLELQNILHVERETPVIPGDFPFVVALGNYNEDTQKYQYFCGGTLISNEFVLTAASCVENEGHIPTVVKFGAISLSEFNKFADKDEIAQEQTIGILRIIVHPDYSNTNRYHNIALIELNRKVSNSSTVFPGCLHTSSAIFEKQQALLTLGWGEASVNEIRFPLLFSIQSKSLSDVDCQSKLNSEITYNLMKSQICAVDNIDSEKDVKNCDVNDGGPVLINVLDKNHVVGIKSFSLPCGAPISAMYTKIADYIDWIDFIVWPGDVEF